MKINSITRKAFTSRTDGGGKTAPLPIGRYAETSRLFAVMTLSIDHVHLFTMVPGIKL
jgi:hypothetical protein